MYSVGKDYNRQEQRSAFRESDCNDGKMNSGIMVRLRGRIEVEVITTSKDGLGVLWITLSKPLEGVYGRDYGWKDGKAVRGL